MDMSVTPAESLALTVTPAESRAVISAVMAAGNQPSGSTVLPLEVAIPLLSGDVDSLVQLDLHNDPIGDHGLCHLAVALGSNRSLAKLEIWRSHLTGQGVTALAEALKGRSEGLKELNMSSNYDMGDEGAIAIGDMLVSNACLETLYMLSVGLSSRGVVALADGLRHNTTLRMLQISDNVMVGDEGATALGSMLAVNSTFKRLWAGGTSMTLEGVAAIAEGLKQNKGLLGLGLPSTRVGYRGAVVLAEALRVNLTLEQLWLSREDVEVRGLVALGEVLRDYPRTPGFRLPISDLRLVSSRLGLPPEARRWDNETILEYWRENHREMFMAFAMGSHDRLGGGSAVRLLVGTADCFEAVSHAFWGG